MFGSGGGGRDKKALPNYGQPLDPLLAEARMQTRLLQQIAEQQKNMIGGLRALLQRSDAQPDMAADLRTLVASTGVDLMQNFEAASGHTELQGIARTVYLEGLRSLRPYTRTGQTTAETGVAKQA